MVAASSRCTVRPSRCSKFSTSFVAAAAVESGYASDYFLESLEAVMTLKLLYMMDQTATQFETRQVAYLNGYAFGDRLLEGVPFKVEVAADGTALNVEIAPTGEDYFSGLDTEGWLSQATEHAREEGWFYDCEDLRKATIANIVLYDTAKPHTEQTFDCPEHIVINGTPVSSPVAV